MREFCHSLSHSTFHTVCGFSAPSQVSEIPNRIQKWFLKINFGKHLRTLFLWIKNFTKQWHYSHWVWHFCFIKLLGLLSLSFSVHILCVVFFIFSAHLPLWALGTMDVRCIALYPRTNTNSFHTARVLCKIIKHRTYNTVEWVLIALQGKGRG